MLTVLIIRSTIFEDTKHDWQLYIQEYGFCKVRKYHICKYQTIDIRSPLNIEGSSSDQFRYTHTVEVNS